MHIKKSSIEDSNL